MTQRLTPSTLLAQGRESSGPSLSECRVVQESPAWVSFNWRTEGEGPVSLPQPQKQKAAAQVLAALGDLCNLFSSSIHYSMKQQGQELGRLSG